MAEKSCSSCLHWDNSGGMGYVDVDKRLVNKADHIRYHTKPAPDAGRCLAHPPASNHPQGMAAFPYTRDKDRCGSWESNSDI